MNRVSIPSQMRASKTDFLLLTELLRKFPYPLKWGLLKHTSLSSCSQSWGIPYPLKWGLLKHEHAFVDVNGDMFPYPLKWGLLKHANAQEVYELNVSIPSQMRASKTPVGGLAFGYQGVSIPSQMRASKTLIIAGWLSYLGKFPYPLKWGLLKLFWRGQQPVNRKSFHTLSNEGF